jgi:isopentenyl diphosphate isomerase/L-lactate dehydrogenase-like FMN-dependent dehydrogenase
MSHVASMLSSNLTWDFIKTMRDTTKMKLIIKGVVIVSEEDAELCVKYGADGIHVSNHGGRSEDSGRGAIECLPEVAKVARGKVPILFDSGVRLGTDIVKALSMGASAVCVGRPYLWGPGAFGPARRGTRVGDSREELSAALQQMWAPNVSGLTPEMVDRGLTSCLSDGLDEDRLVSHSDVCAAIEPFGQQSRRPGAETSTATAMPLAVESKAGASAVAVGAGLALHFCDLP